MHTVERMAVFIKHHSAFNIHSLSHVRIFNDSVFTDIFLSNSSYWAVYTLFTCDIIRLHIAIIAGSKQNGIILVDFKSPLCPYIILLQMHSCYCALSLVLSHTL